MGAPKALQKSRRCVKCPLHREPPAQRGLKPMQPNKKIVMGLGEVLWDLLPAGKQLGGAPANFVYHAHALGAEAWLVSRVGNDPLGWEILGSLQSLALPTDCVT